MLIDIATLPPTIQQQIRQENSTVQFADNGKVIAVFAKQSVQSPAPPKDSLMAAAGLFKDYGIDGLAYERQIRSEWD